MPKKTSKENMTGTKIAELPNDSDVEVDTKELALLNSILNVDKKSPEQYHSTIKYVMTATGIFIVLSLPFIDRLFELALPIARSWLILLACKTILFFVLFYIVFHIMKK